MPFPDWEAYYSVAPRPERLPAPPTTINEPAYSLTSWFWSDVAQWALSELGRDVAAYYPQSGYLQVQDSSGAHWFRLDSERQLLLNRYLRLGRGARAPVASAMAAYHASALSMTSDAPTRWLRGTARGGHFGSKGSRR